MELEAEFGVMKGLGRCSKGRPMFRPMVFPPASCAPRLAASMMPGPPPLQITKRRVELVSSSDHSVMRRASSRASCNSGRRRCISNVRAEPKNTMVS